MGALRACVFGVASTCYPRSMRHAAVLLGCIGAGLGCEPAADPPMRARESTPLTAPVPSAAQTPSATTTAAASTEIPTAHGFASKLAAIALETSIYEEPRWSARRIGYLRVGTVVPRETESSGTGPRCPGGWYRVAPRGFVCAGAFASLDPNHPVALAMAHAPKTDGLPYLYVMSRSPTPILYARLPTRHEQSRFEPDVWEHLRDGAVTPAGLPPAEPIPGWLTPGQPPLSLGNEWRGADRVMLGRGRPRSGFSLLATYDVEGRRFGLTTANELIALDRTKLVKQSAFHGLEIDALPVGFAKSDGAPKLGFGGEGLMPIGALSAREGIALTQEVKELNGFRYLVARDGSFIAESKLTVIRPMKRPPAWATPGQKWIEVSIPRQSLVAYVGDKPVYATLVSTGVGGAGDPVTEHATVQGAFAIYEKHIAVTMDGHEASDAFDLRDVPWVQYFHEGFALHAAYWHDDFGHLHSHGCVNLAPVDAAWLFGWTDPRMPEGWHGVMAKAGTTVYVHD